jgi:hypothetical protein
MKTGRLRPKKYQCFSLNPKNEKDQCLRSIISQEKFLLIQPLHTSGLQLIDRSPPTSE